MMLVRAHRPGSLRMRLRARLIGLSMMLSIVAVAGTLGACSSIGNLGVPAATGPLLTVSMRGGMCANGACDTSVILDRDGRVHSAAKPPNELGRVSGQAMANLSTAIAATDYAAIRAHPFTGECPVNFDGQELIFEFLTGAGTQRIASCEVDIDWGHPLFVAVGVALGEWIPLPLT